SLNVTMSESRELQHGRQLYLQNEERRRLRAASDAATVTAESKEINASTRIWTQITFSMDYDQPLIAHTLQHYTRAGLDPQCFLISLHQTSPDTDTAATAAITDQLERDYGIRHIQAWYGNFTSQQSWEHKIAQRQAVGVSSQDWIVKVDADELVRLGDIPSLLQGMAERDYDVVYGAMIDRVSLDGGLSSISNQTSLAEQFPLECHVTKAGHANTTKAIAFRGYLTEYRAGHGMLHNQTLAGVYPQRLVIDHYKWSDSVLAKLLRRKQHYQWLEQQGRGHHWWRESDHFLHHLYTHERRIDVGNEEFLCRRAALSPVLAHS
ncbi:MAG: hypothetical protein SGILL_007019, partial [Bacillariaceae sp.]